MDQFPLASDYRFYVYHSADQSSTTPFSSMLSYYHLELRKWMKVKKHLQFLPCIKS